MRINLTSTTYARTSLATNPLAEAAMSVRELLSPRASPWLRLWRRQALPLALGLDLAPVRILFTACDLAEILSPPPAEPTPDFHRQLDELVAGPDEWLARDLRRLYGRSVPAAARDHLRSPRSTLDRLANTLEKYWATVIGPWWPRLSALLEQDLLYRAQTLTRQTLPTMVNGLHPGLRATDDAVSFRPRSSAAGPRSSAVSREMVAGPGGIVFVASAFVNDGPLLNAEAWDRTAIFYRVRGVGTLDEQQTRRRRTADALSVLLSHRRADLVRAVRTPSTPSELARVLGVTSSAVSQQLTQLGAAGLVSRNQFGRKAYYQLTATGLALLQVLDRTG
jgi:DNA-binding HxlR family transcriptional regulator